jgi:hypothetical protein
MPPIGLATRCGSMSLQMTFLGVRCRLQINSLSHQLQQLVRVYEPPDGVSQRQMQA